MTILGFDFGATKLSALLVDGNQRVYDRIILPTNVEFIEEKNVIARFIQKMAERSLNKIDKCVCSIAATVDDNGNVVCWPCRNYWEGKNIKELFDETFGVKVIFEDDGNVGAYAEAHVMNIGNLIYVAIGSGVGGGIVLNHQLVKGDLNKAAEIGHICVISGGIDCVCGRKGCLQAYASATAILKRAYGNKWLNKSKIDLQMDLKKNEKEVVASIEVAAEMLAIVFMNLNEIMGIKNFVIGGGMGTDFYDLYSRINFYMQRLMRKGQPILNIMSAKYGQNSSLEGTILLANSRERSE